MNFFFFLKKKPKPTKLSTFDLAANDDDGLEALSALLRTLENAKMHMDSQIGGQIPLEPICLWGCKSCWQSAQGFSIFREPWNGLG